jgi:hypothetical protein
MANNALFINIASILWAADISPIKDDEGTPIIPNTMETLSDTFTVLDHHISSSIRDEADDAFQLSSSL